MTQITDEMVEEFWDAYDADPDLDLHLEDERLAIRAGLAAALAAMWRPIESAPRDGTETLVWNGARRQVATFDRIEAAWVSTFRTATKRLPISPEPTHWQPLPSPPEKE